MNLIKLTSVFTSKHKIEEEAAAFLSNLSVDFKYKPVVWILLVLFSTLVFFNIAGIGYILEFYSKGFSNLTALIGFFAFSIVYFSKVAYNLYLYLKLTSPLISSSKEAKLFLDMVKIHKNIKLYQDEIFKKRELFFYDFKKATEMVQISNDTRARQLFKDYDQRKSRHDRFVFNFKVLFLMSVFVYVSASFMVEAVFMQYLFGVVVFSLFLAAYQGWKLFSEMKPLFLEPNLLDQYFQLKDNPAGEKLLFEKLPLMLGTPSCAEFLKAKKEILRELHLT